LVELRKQVDREFAFQQPAQDIGIEQVPAGHRLNAGALTGPRGQQALGGQHLDRLARDRAADAMLGREIRLGRKGPVFKRARHDLPPQQVQQPIGQIASEAAGNIVSGYERKDQSMTLSAIDTAMVVAYAIFIFGLAQWVSRRKGDVQEDSTGYFLASRALPWWAIGASLIAANISAEQIVGMAGSGYAIGLAFSSYEWMAALTLLIVGKFFLPVFLKNNITTMPEFLEARFGPTIRTVMALFWLVLYVFVNLTSILWL
ncbi:hypothetical protein E4T56_gene13697, partial [Termitomyces sp. T112]